MLLLSSFGGNKSVSLTRIPMISRDKVKYMDFADIYKRNLKLFIRIPTRSAKVIAQHTRTSATTVSCQRPETVTRVEAIFSAGESVAPSPGIAL